MVAIHCHSRGTLGGPFTLERFNDLPQKIGFCDIDIDGKIGQLLFLINISGDSTYVNVILKKFPEAVRAQASSVEDLVQSASYKILSALLGRM
jgi:hypothetical protein